MSYSERIEEWAEQHKKKLTVLYIIWCIGLITVAMLFGAGVLELKEINFDPEQVPVGFMDKGKMLTGEPKCIEYFDDDGNVIGESCIVP